MPSSANKPAQRKRSDRRRIHPAVFALASDGSVLLNAGEFDDARDLVSALACAERQPGKIFVGVVLTDAEARSVLPDSSYALSAAAASMIGARQARQRRRGRPGRGVRG